MTQTKSMLVEEAGDGAEWDAFVAKTSGSSHMHLFGWSRVVKEVFGHDSIMLTARDSDGHIQGVLPVTILSSVLFGRLAVSMPYLNYGGPLGSDEAIRRLIDHATILVRKRRVKSFELRSRFPLQIGLPSHPTKVTVVLDLPDTAELLLKKFDGKLRSQLKRAAKAGAVSAHGLGQLHDFYSVFKHHMRDLGTPVLPLQFFESSAREFGSTIWVCSVQLGGEPIAGAMGFRWNDEFEITWASALAEHKQISPNMFLYWSLLERCINEGITQFNFGRTTPGSGPHRFKLQWGGREVALHWYYPLGGKDSLPRKEKSHFALAARIWKKLPLSVADYLGPRIVRGIP
jgi:serine/alanine adding enzyme